MPYYAGITAHTAQGRVRALRLGLLSGGGFAKLFLNLSAFKPLSDHVLEGLWVAFVLAAAGIVAIAFFAARWNQESPANGHKIK